MKLLYTLSLCLISFTFLGQECSQISFRNSIQEESNLSVTRIIISEDGNGDFYFENQNSISISNSTNLILTVTDQSFFNYYSIEVVSNKFEKNMDQMDSISLCEPEYILNIKIGDKVIQSKTIIQK